MGNFQRRPPSTTCLQFIISKISISKFAKLIKAVKAGNLNQVKSFYKSNVNFNQTLQTGDTPLHIAVKYSKLGIVKFISENIPQLDFNEKNFNGDTPLMLAVMNGDLKMVEFLVYKKSVDIDTPENRGFTPFMAACANGDVQVIKFLVKNGCNFKVKSKDGQTGLHRAAFYGNMEAVKYLIKDLKLNMLLPDKKGNLPLHQACMKLNFSCIRLLIKASHLSELELLHKKNKFGVKPIDILLKVLNRLREFDETKEFKDDQIEEYIKDKRNVPIPKTDLSPASVRGKQKSATASPTLARNKRPTLFVRESPRPSTVFPQLISSPLSESVINLKSLEPNESSLFLARKNREFLEEDFIRISRTPNDSLLDMSPVPLLYSKGPSLGSLESSPKSFVRRKTKISSLAYVNEARSPSPILIKPSQNSKSFLRSKTGVKFSISSTDEIKNSNNQISPTLNVRFASASKDLEEME